MNELKTAIYNRLTSSSTFNTNIGGRVYYMRAPQSTNYPYCVYSFFADNHTFDSGNKWEEVYIQFSIYSDTSSSEQVDSLVDNLVTLLDTTLTISSYTQISLIRKSRRHLISADDEWVTILEYRIEIEHN